MVSDLIFISIQSSSYDFGVASIACTWPENQRNKG
jgi:hypothetical protein